MHLHLTMENLKMHFKENKNDCRQIWSAVILLIRKKQVEADHPLSFFRKERRDWQQSQNLT